MTSAGFYNSAVLAYVLAMFAFVFNLVWQKEIIRRICVTVVALGFLCQTFGMGIRWMEAGLVEVQAAERTLGEPLTGLSHFIVFTQHPPWSNLYEIMVFMAWGLVLVFLVTEVLWRIRFLGVFALLLALSAFGVASLTDGTIKPLVPALKSWWIMVHVISASIAYSAGSITAVVSFLYLIRAKDKISLSQVACGVMALSAFLLFLVGRGFELLSTGVYRVKLMAMGPAGEQVVGIWQEGKFTPFYAGSPYAGPTLLLAIVLCALVACVLYIQRRSDLPKQGVKALYMTSMLVTWASLIVVVANNLRHAVVQISGATAPMLYPQGPWYLSMRSNTWDLGLFGIVVGIQLFVAVTLFIPSKIRGLLPEPEKLDRTAYSNVMVAFALMAFVLISGALWAHYAWGRYWAWDPKETGALVIWLTYALYLHTRLTYGWAGVRSAVVGITGFFIILAGFLGVNLGWFADGLHSYGSS